MSYDMHELIDYQATIGIYENIWISNEDIQTSVFNSLSIHIPRTLRTMAINTIFTEIVSVENRM